MSACDPLMQAERRCQARYLDRSRWDLFPCRGSVVPCRTLSLVSAICPGTVKTGVSGDPRIRRSATLVATDFTHIGWHEAHVEESCRGCASLGSPNRTGIALNPYHFARRTHDSR